MKRARIWAVSVAVALALPLFAQAQTTRTDSKSGSADKKMGDKMAGADHKFVMKAASGGKAEVQLGRLASERGSSAAVKQFGQRMVSDHGKANTELTQLAQQKGMTLPADMDTNHKRVIDRLSKLSGAEFDRAYAREMKKDHDEDVKEFSRVAKSGQDADIKAWAAKTLPVLQEHQQQAQQLSAAAPSSGSTK